MLTLKNIKDFVLFLLMILAFTFVFYVAYRYFYAVYEINITYAQRHLVTKENSKKSSMINKDFKTSVYQTIKTCITNKNVPDYYKLGETQFLFGKEFSHNDWEVLTTYAEGKCTSSMLNATYDKSGFNQTLYLHDILINMNYNISKDWPN